MDPVVWRSGSCAEVPAAGLAPVPASLGVLQTRETVQNNVVHMSLAMVSALGVRAGFTYYRAGLSHDRFQREFCVA
jgi:hypothetical protein